MRSVRLKEKERGVILKYSTMSAGVRLTIRLRFGIVTHCLYFVGMGMGSVDANESSRYSTDVRQAGHVIGQV